MRLPQPRGALSRAVFATMTESPDVPAALCEVAPESLGDEQITLWALYALHEHDFDDVDPRREWDPRLLTIRGQLEGDFEARLRHRWADQPAASEEESDEPAPIADRIFTLTEQDEGPSLAAHVHRQATAEQVCQLLRWRSLYHLREADPSTWVIPRLGPEAKAALVELQFDEYGGGRPERLHSQLFANGMAASGLDPSPGAYVDEAPDEVLEQNNAMSLFGLHRRLRGAAVGHLAAFEATSSMPSRRMSQGLARLGFAEELRHYYDEHVEADAVHEQLAARGIAAALVAEDEALTEDVLFGAFTCLDLERRFAERALTEWEAV